MTIQVTGKANNLVNQGKHVFKHSKKIIYASLLAAALSACGGGGGGGGGTESVSGGELIGTGFMGKAAIGAAIADADILIKSQSGTSLSTTTNTNGDFNSNELSESPSDTNDAAYLLRIEKSDGSFLYSIAHQENATVVDDDSRAITINIHPFTDLIIRNWFAQQNPGQDIDALMAGDTPINLPTADDISAIGNEFINLLTEALKANNTANPETFNLLSGDFEINQPGFDQFLDNSQVIIINNMINLYITQPDVANPIQNLMINDVALDSDFTDNNNADPSLPENVRVLATDTAGEAIIVWQPSTDDKGVAYYQIYRDGNLQITTPFPVFIDSSLSAGVAYEYTIEAVDGQGASSGQTASVGITLDQPDTTAPEPVTSISATGSNGVIELSWGLEMIDNIDDIAGFRILRGPSGNVTEEIANVASTYFTDNTIALGTTYCYQVISYDGAGNTSSASAEACASTGGATFESTVAFSAENYTVNESAGSITITVNRSGDISQAISVDYAATSGTATAGSDFTASSGTLSWTALDTTDKTFTVQLLTDSETESDETVNLSLSNPSLNLINGNDTALLTIANAEPVACIDLSPTDITTDTTLSAPCYNVDSNIDISNAATLTINPGVRLNFAAGTELNVEDDGILTAIGTAEAPIIFTGAIAAPGYWDGLEVESIATSQLDHIIVEYGGGSSFNEANIGISFDGRLSVSNSIIRHSGSYGVRYSNNNARITNFANNTLTLNQDAPILLPASQVGVLNNDSSFSGNITTNGDRDYIEVMSGTDVTTPQQWNLLDVDYRMPGSTTDISSELTLAPGVTLVFPADAGLNINNNGTLNAVGTQSQPITFTGLQQSVGFWDGIQFTFNNNNNVMDHTIVEYGGGDGNTEANVGVFGSDGRLTIRNSILRHSSLYGFDFGSSINLVMDNVSAESNDQPGVMDLADVGMLDNNSQYTGNADNRVVLRYSTVNSDQTLKNIGVPYRVAGTSTNSIAAELTIEAGAEIQFETNGGFNVSATGTLIAQGTPVEPITFTGTQQSPGSWNGIQFTFSNNPNLIDNAVIEYAGAPTGNTQALVGFYGSGSLVSNGSVTNTVLRSSQTNGIWIETDTTGDFSTGNTFEDIAGENIFIDE